jgi:hypothetical protein
MQISAFEQAALHACKIIAWALGSAAIPAVIALYSGNPYWLIAAPFINAAAAGLVKWSGIQAAAPAQQ